MWWRQRPRRAGRGAVTGIDRHPRPLVTPTRRAPSLSSPLRGGRPALGSVGLGSVGLGSVGLGSVGLGSVGLGALDGVEGSNAAC